MTDQSTPTRRKMLAGLATLAVSGSSMAALSGRMDLISAALAARGDYRNLNDYRSLVCVFLYGGNDSFNMFPPASNTHYQRYAAARGVLSVPRSQVLTTSNNAIGFHPELRRLRNRFNRGDLAIVSNVGNLVGPLTRDQYLSETAPAPVDLFGHNTQQEQWLKGLSSRPTGVTNTGWGGRMADMLLDANASQLPPTLSVAGTNFWLPGGRTTPLAVHPQNGLLPLRYLDSQVSGSSLGRENTTREILARNHSHLLKAQVSTGFSRAWDMSRTLDGVIQNSPSFSTPFNGGSRLSTQLRMVANLISAREQLGMHRQVFFVGADGWDTHDNQNTRLPALLRDLDESLAGFQNTVEEMGVEQSVTTFSASDFGRTLSINGDGTDHGWGGHALVLGGAVQGGELYGRPLSYKLGGREDIGDGGRFIPTTSINQYGGILARWMGIDDGDLQQIFPDLRNHGDNWADGLAFMG